ncbi:phasin family protein [Chamaesiphon sp.]|uniref:phasin family protein n=1 Tax=Chamaesiphon sp. TaxID=2814140 RepID=UPI003594556C
MAGLGDIVQKAFYLGVGLATVAGEQAGEKISSIGVQAQKLTDEMVAKGEITTEEARKLVDEMIRSAQQQNLNQAPSNNSTRPQKNTEPRRIEIVADGESPSPSRSTDNSVSDMRKQVADLQEELKRMKNS